MVIASSFLRCAWHGPSKRKNNQRYRDDQSDTTLYAIKGEVKCPLRHVSVPGMRIDFPNLRSPFTPFKYLHFFQDLLPSTK